MSRKSVARNRSVVVKFKKLIETTYSDVMMHLRFECCISRRNHATIELHATYPFLPAAAKNTAIQAINQCYVIKI